MTFSLVRIQIHPDHFPPCVLDSSREHEKSTLAKKKLQNKIIKMDVPMFKDE